MLKSLICFIGLCSSAYTATNIPKTLDAVIDTPEVSRDATIMQEASHIATDAREVLEEVPTIPDTPEVSRDATIMQEASHIATDAREVLEEVPTIPDAAEVSRDAFLQEATIPSEITGGTIDTPKVPKVEINVEPIPQGKWMKDTPKYVVISALPQNVKLEHVFICLNGNITCSVPDDAQLKNEDKFSETQRASVINEKNNFINIPEKNYDNFANYLINSHYAIERTEFISAWGGVRDCYDFSINITLQRMIKEFNNQLEVRDGYTDENLHQDYQLDVLHNILQALINKGISKKNILGLSDIALSVVHITPYTPFWRQFYERHDGFFNVPKFSTTYKIKDANELEEALLKIGYTNPIDPKTHEKCIGEDCWVRRAVNAFILRYLPEERFKFNGLDRAVVTKESAYAEENTSFDESILEFLHDKNNKKILNYIVENSRRPVTNLPELSDALAELGYKKEEGERENRMIARAVSNVSRHLFGYPYYHKHTFIYPPEGTCYSKELTYNILRDQYPYILSAIDQISNL